MKTADRVFGWLLVLGGILHSGGAIAAANGHPADLVWPLAGSLAAFLVAALNLMRVNRPADRMLARVSAAGSIAWAGVAIGFGLSIGNVFDPRGLYHAIVGAVLAVFSVRTSIAARG